MSGRADSTKLVIGAIGCGWGVLVGLYALSFGVLAVGIVAAAYMEVCGWAIFDARRAVLVVVPASALLATGVVLAGAALGGGAGGLAGTVVAIAAFVPPTVGAIVLGQADQGARPEQGVCATCGYSLAGLASNRCPECGAINAPTLEREPGE